MNTFVYIDAFNLYFGAVRGTPYKWLDLKQLCHILLPRHEITQIKYFTARVNARPSDPDQPTRQATYFRALSTIPNLSIYFGHFLTHIVKMPLAYPVPGQNSYAEVFKTEEKGSDVNLATHLLHDAHCDLFECAVIISGDSDLLMPLRIVKEDLQKPAGVINPQRHPCRVLQNQATFYKHIRTSALKQSQFPSPMKDVKGTFLKPTGW
jgi:hypothetical protein